MLLVHCKMRSQPQPLPKQSRKSKLLRPSHLFPRSSNLANGDDDDDGGGDDDVNGDPILPRSSIAPREHC